MLGLSLALQSNDKLQWNRGTSNRISSACSRLRASKGVLPARRASKEGRKGAVNLGVNDAVAQAPQKGSSSA